MRRLRTFFVILALLFVSFGSSASFKSQAQSTPPAWAPNTAYAVGQLVTYNGLVYKCIQAHTSEVGWEPPNVPALWGLQSGTAVPSNTPVPPTNTSVPPTNTHTAVPPTSTPTFTHPAPTNTGVPPTATNTLIAPTATKTFTPIPPTATATFTPPPPTATNNTALPTNTPIATSGGCSVAAWSSTAVYVGGNQASYNGHLWQAKWWTQGDIPGGPAGVWTDLGICGTQPTATNTAPPTNTPLPTNTFTPGPSATPTTVPTSVPSPTLCSNCGGSLPEHVLTGYWQDFTGNGAAALHLRDVPTTYGLIGVAFANATGTPGQVSFSIDPQLASALGGYTDANFISDIQTLHSQGRKVIVSVGGQNGAVSVSDATSAANFANSVYAIMSQYGFDGVDIDLENGLSPTYMASALEQLSSKVGSGLIITLAPQTIDMQSTSGDYFQLALSIKSILTIVNMQYYNSGSMLGCDGNVYSEGGVDFLTALACIQLQGGLRPDQIGLGLPANSSGAGSGAVSPTIVNNALDCLETGANCGSFHPSTTYHGIRGVMDWNVNWDANNGYQFANTITGHFSALP